MPTKIHDGPATIGRGTKKSWRQIITESLAKLLPGDANIKQRSASQRTWENFMLRHAHVGSVRVQGKRGEANATVPVWRALPLYHSRGKYKPGGRGPQTGKHKCRPNILKGWRK